MASPALPRPPVVVVVDDDPAVLAALKFALEVDGFTVMAFQSGERLLSEGIDAAEGCLVIDEVMPGGIAGLDLIAAMREAGIAFPAILITGHRLADLAERAREAGVTIVEKPLIGSVLSDTIRSALSRRH